ncbi:MAG: hypothetical protein JWQ49_5799 [Edaphobacter sp.]|nr:hypothetical protein [Edaphobacter sp.]
MLFTAATGNNYRLWILRGSAVIGIFASTNQDFSGQALSGTLFSSPNATPSALQAHLNLVAYFLQNNLFQWQSHGLLSMLFGSGVVILVDHVENRAGPKQAQTATRS